MISNVKKENCCGCGACVRSCPLGVLTMANDPEGFSYPLAVKPDSCTNCGICDNACMYINPLTQKPAGESYGVKAASAKIRKSSSSGGVFTLLAKLVIEKGGVVFGAYIDPETLKCRHGYAEKLEDCKRFRGSKYVQSDLGDAFADAKRFLKQDRLVLFTGTPCQIAGLRRYLKNDYDNLIAMDFICHGVPSPLALDRYIDELPYGRERITDIVMRHKQKGWITASSVLLRVDGETVRAEGSDYLYAFKQNLTLRPSCHNCAANNFRSGADITIGDYWGCATKHRAFDDGRGVSLFFTHSKKGSDIWAQIRNETYYVDAPQEHIVVFNPNLVRPTQKSPRRDAFMTGLACGENFWQLCKKNLSRRNLLIRKLLPPAAIRQIQMVLAKVKGR